MRRACAGPPTLILALVLPLALALNDAVRAAVQRNPRAALLDLHDQLCTADKFYPKRLSGIQVHDDTGPTRRVPRTTGSAGGSTPFTPI